MTWPAFFTAATTLTLIAATHLALVHAYKRSAATTIAHTQIRDFYQAATHALTAPGATTASIDQLQAADRDIKTQLPHHPHQAALIARTNTPPTTPARSRT